MSPNDTDETCRSSPKNEPESHKLESVTSNENNTLDASCHIVADNGAKENPDLLSRAKKPGVLGFEPRLSDPESLVLPLHHTPVSTDLIKTIICQQAS